MDQRLGRIGNMLKDVTTQDWKVRVEALRELRSCLNDATVLQVKSLVGNLVKQIGDGRSLVMQDACETATAVCSAFGSEPEFSAVADAFVKACLPIVSSSTKVMSDAAKGCLQQVVLGTPRGYQTPLDRFVKGCTDTTRATTYRLECVRLVDLCMNEWDTEWLSKGESAECIEVAVRKALRDADPEVRTAARMAFTTLARLFPDHARKSLKEMEPEDRQRFQDLFPPTATAPATGSFLHSAAKRTPHHSSVKRSATTVSSAPQSAIRQPLSSRKPLQAMSVNLNTPAPKTAMKFREEKLVSFAPGTVASNMANTVKKTAQKPARLTVRDRVSRAIIDCFGAEDTPAARARRTSAMRELASVFVGMADELTISDFVSCIHAIESCLSSLDETVCAAGMDAFGTFIVGLQVKDPRDADMVKMDILRTCFPIALKRSTVGFALVEEAASRAVDACFELIEHTQLLSTVVNFQRTYRDDSVLPAFIGHQQQWEMRQNQGTPRTSLATPHQEEEFDPVVEDEVPMTEEEREILRYARLLNDDDAEARRNAVDALVTFRRRNSAQVNTLLESSLSGPQLKLLDCFVRRSGMVAM